MTTKKETDDSPSYAYLAPLDSPLNKGPLRVRVVVDRRDGEALSEEELAEAEKLYPPAAEAIAAPARKASKKTTKKRSAAKRR